ncbi:MAG: recombination protein O N-terminal domain-containing protein [Candidatus Pacebacteria bacterium]|nr:recombination protein O N-terminal domain-containing protein [Candidatus Paceibacterota bacterium]MBP9842820.1 recombination protein O N-terminal domain-containing protein [Candidatus Paceibacterota bacterium]
MSYQTYTTEAIVCGTFNKNTADRSYLLFTREAGMLYAEARSVREERSRQRMALQDFSFVRVSLVKGKSSWKVGSIQSEKNFFLSAGDKEARGSVVSITKFIRRFYGGQEAAPVLFDYVVGALQLLSSFTTHRDFLEKIIQTRILFELGYVDVKVLPEAVMSEVEALASIVTSDSDILKLKPIIEKAVSFSHL